MGKIQFLLYTGKVLVECVEYGNIPILEVDPADYYSEEEAWEEEDQPMLGSIAEQLRYWGLDVTMAEKISEFISGRLDDCHRPGEVVFKRSPECQPILITLLPYRW